MTTTAVRRQFSFRWRKDDGTETTATWWATENTNPATAAMPLNANIRIRFEIGETAGGTGSIGAQLQYQINGGTWTNVNASSLYVRSSASANFADGDTVTNQLTTANAIVATFSGSRMDEVDGLITSISYSSSHGEPEHCIQLRSADFVAGDVLALRETNAGTVFDIYTNTPSYIPVAGSAAGRPIFHRDVRQAIQRASFY